MPSGEGWNADTITQAFDRLAHTHASHLLVAGVNVKVSSERLGHASAAFTMDIYVHVIPGQQADASSAVSALVGRSVISAAFWAVQIT